MTFSPCFTNSNEPNIGYWGAIFHLDIYGAILSLWKGNGEVSTWKVYKHTSSSTIFLVY